MAGSSLLSIQFSYPRARVVRTGRKQYRAAGSATPSARANYARRRGGNVVCILR
ncbi:hypothetical protein I545_4291 [Mycobacterium kansasii 662]|uniref:Uncharacterized protein n=2 Tax=Mycobacterium kansasii TaxID=1768 RepID=A0A1V3X2A9_MYCKA|nr:hypothetical protein I547_7505 [Mycobacterium kansasii 824]EUA16571.1 hypothetical protein I545_4291 [Mycobacterium kansasii 662]OOK72976.1 hypothetical protein BZL29_4957 [Mycobacterium kansasii]OOK76156.1 hypothetical protein BZL30_3256 [Mycobacterium kansasii]